MTRLFLVVLVVLAITSTACTNPPEATPEVTSAAPYEATPEPASRDEIELLDCQENTTSKNECRSLGPKDVYCCPIEEPSCDGYMLGGAALLDRGQYRCAQSAHGYTALNGDATPRLDRFGCFAVPSGTQQCQDYFACDFPTGDHDLSEEWLDMGEPSQRGGEDLNTTTEIEHLDSNRPRSCSDICTRHDLRCDPGRSRSHVGVASYEGDRELYLVDCLDVPKRSKTFEGDDETSSLERITCTCS